MDQANEEMVATVVATCCAVLLVYSAMYGPRFLCVVENQDSDEPSVLVDIKEVLERSKAEVVSVRPVSDPVQKAKAKRRTISPCFFGMTSALTLPAAQS